MKQIYKMMEKAVVVASFTSIVCGAGCATTSDYVTEAESREGIESYATIGNGASKVTGYNTNGQRIICFDKDGDGTPDSVELAFDMSRRREGDEVNKFNAGLCFKNAVQPFLKREIKRASEAIDRNYRIEKEHHNYVRIVSRDFSMDYNVLTNDGVIERFSAKDRDTGKEYVIKLEPTDKANSEELKGLEEVVAEKLAEFNKHL